MNSTANPLRYESGTRKSSPAGLVEVADAMLDQSMV
jgi:hypothetical protein